MSNSVDVGDDDDEFNIKKYIEDISNLDKENDINPIFKKSRIDNSILDLIIRVGNKNETDFTTREYHNKGLEREPYSAIFTNNFKVSKRFYNTGTIHDLDFNLKSEDFTKGKTEAVKSNILDVTNYNLENKITGISEAYFGFDLRLFTHIILYIYNKLYNNHRGYSFRIYIFGSFNRDYLTNAEIMHSRFDLDVIKEKVKKLNLLSGEHLKTEINFAFDTFDLVYCKEMDTKFNFEKSYYEDLNNVTSEGEFFKYIDRELNDIGKNVYNNISHLREESFRYSLNPKLGLFIVVSTYFTEGDIGPNGELKEDVYNTDLKLTIRTKELKPRITSVTKFNFESYFIGPNLYEDIKIFNVPNKKYFSTNPIKGLEPILVRDNTENNQIVQKIYDNIYIEHLNLDYLISNISSVSKDLVNSVNRINKRVYSTFLRKSSCSFAFSFHSCPGLEQSKGSKRFLVSDIEKTLSGKILINKSKSKFSKHQRGLFFIFQNEYQSI
jgi:hypothetical protein